MPLPLLQWGGMEGAPVFALWTLVDTTQLRIESPVLPKHICKWSSAEVIPDWMSIVHRRRRCHALPKRDSGAELARSLWTGTIWLFVHTNEWTAEASEASEAWRLQPQNAPIPGSRLAAVGVAAKRIFQDFESSSILGFGELSKVSSCIMSHHVASLVVLALSGFIKSHDWPSPFHTFPLIFGPYLSAHILCFQRCEGTILTVLLFDPPFVPSWPSWPSWS